MLPVTASINPRLGTAQVNVEDILKEISIIIRDITGDDDAELTANTVADDVDGWDSVNHIKIILAIESEFSVHFDMSQVSAVEKVGDLVELVAGQI